MNGLINRKWILAAALCSFAWSVGAQEQFASIRVCDAVRLRTPILTDSVNTEGTAFSASSVLKTEVPLIWSEKSSQAALCDSEGWFGLEKADKDYLLYVAGTNIRSDLFLKGKLKITSPVRWQLYVNGELKHSKEQAEDSLSLAVPAEVALSLEPQKDYVITLKVLSDARDKADPAVRCEFLKDSGYEQVTLWSGPDLKKRFALSNTVFGNRVSGVSVSPDGRFLLTFYRNSFSKDRQVNQVVLSELKTGKVLDRQLPEGVRWMPSSTKLYYKVKADNGVDLHTIDPVSGQDGVLVTCVPDQRFVWSPDESYLIFFPEEKGVKENGPLIQVVTPDDRIPGYRERTFLARFDLQTKTMERLTFGHHSTVLQDISADGKKLLYTVSHENLTKRPFTYASLYELSLEDMSVDTLISDEGFLSSAAYSPDGNRILLTASPEAFGGIGKNCGTHPIANDFDTQAFILNRADGTIDPITKEFNPTVEFLQWNQGDGCIYFNTTDKDCKHIYRYHPSKRSYEQLPLEVDVVKDFSLSKKNPSYAAYTGQTNYTCGVAYQYDLKRGKSVLIDDPMQETLADLELGKVEPWNFMASDGTLIEGMICLPPSFDASRKYPLIVYYYGGTTPTERGITSPYGPQMFASRDYVVYIVQPSGAIGYGQEFSARHVNAWGIRTADDIIEGTKAFCKAHPFVDAERIGCLGASYGGFMTQYLQTRTDIFAAAVSHAGISNVTSYWGEGYWGYSYNSIAAADSYPWSEPDLFTRQGSLFNADKIHTPLLLLHGTVDTNVPMGESIQLFNALKLLGREVAFVQVEGENHFVADYDKRQLWQNSIMAWFERWLKGRPQWWNELYPKRYL